MLSRCSATSISAANPTHDHVVAFYTDDDELTAAVARFIGEGVDGGRNSVVVATPQHRASIRAVVNSRRSLDLHHYVELDAAAALALITLDGAPDRAAFAATLGPVLTAAAALGSVRVLGETVALLWDEGRATDAIVLEGMWNELRQQREPNLLRSYPVAAIDGEGNLGPGKRICDQHSHAMTLGEPLPDGPVGSRTASEVREIFRDSRHGHATRRGDPSGPSPRAQAGTTRSRGS